MFFMAKWFLTLKLSRVHVILRTLRWALVELVQYELYDPTRPSTSLVQPAVVLAVVLPVVLGVFLAVVLGVFVH